VRREWGKEWANKDKYQMVYLSLVCRCPGPRRVCGQFRLGESKRLQKVLLARLHLSDRCVTPVRLVQVWADRGLVFMSMVSLGLVLEVVVLVVGLESL
jgi:hypothetical protein